MDESILKILSISVIPQTRGQQAFSAKEQIVNSFGFVCQSYTHAARERAYISKQLFSLNRNPLTLWLLFYDSPWAQFYFVWA